MDFLGNQHGVLRKSLLVAEMSRFGEDGESDFMFVPSRYMLDKGVIDVGYVPILGSSIFGRFG